MSTTPSCEREVSDKLKADGAAILHAGEKDLVSRMCVAGGSPEQVISYLLATRLMALLEAEFEDLSADDRRLALGLLLVGTPFEKVKEFLRVRREALKIAPGLRPK